MTPENSENHLFRVLAQDEMTNLKVPIDPEDNSSEILENNVLFLIGAGCSAEAGVKVANQMVADIEHFVKTDDRWKKFADLYYYLKSSILYSDGIHGNFTTSLNVEKLVVIINELAKKELNVAYPFIGNWNTRLIEVGGENFQNIKDFGEEIAEQLFKWINIGDYSGANHYKGFADFKREIGYAIRIFSFNYDICIEQIINDLTIELGFDPQNKRWAYSNFDFNQNKDIDIYLYKLHGSIDWKRDKSNGNILIKQANPITGAELIFGTDAKLTSIDPYLFYVFEFRRYSLLDECKLIIVIGYSFGDEYMNKLMAQALSASPNRKVLIVDFGDPESIKDKFAADYNINKNQIETWQGAASEFLLKKLNQTEIYKYFPLPEDSAF